MRFSTGAGGFAAAVFLLSLGIFNPTPSRAWEMNVPAVTVPPPAPVLSSPETAPATPAPAAEPAPAAAQPDEA